MEFCARNARPKVDIEADTADNTLFENTPQEKVDEKQNVQLNQSLFNLEQLPLNIEKPCILSHDSLIASDGRGHSAKLSTDAQTVAAESRLKP